MNKYTGYGLGLLSELHLPELQQGHQQADVTIKLGSVVPPFDRTDDAIGKSAIVEQSAYLHWNGVGTFSISAGREIIIEPAPNATAERIRLFLLNATMGMLLQQRGQFVFHGSAVAIQGEAVAFLGDKGWGKSTMAASLYQKGHSLISDDVLSFEPQQQEQLIVHPAFAQLKLWPDSLALVTNDYHQYPKLHPDFEKRSYIPDAGLIAHAAPLRSVYVLDYGDEPTIESISGADAVLDLLPHWYCARFGSDVLSDLGRGRHFMQCVEVVNRSAIYRLRRPRSLDILPEIVRLIEQHNLDQVPSPGGSTHAES